MDTLIKNEEDAKNLAARLFAVRFPDNQAFFDSGWDRIRSRLAGAVNADSVMNSADLLATSAPDTMAIEMVQEVAVFFEAFMTRFPVAREELIKRVAGVCIKYGRETEYVREIESRIDAVTNNEGSFVVWTSAPSGLGSKEAYYSESELKKRVLPRFENYGIAIKGRSVMARMPAKLEYVQLEEPPYRLLVILLRYKDENLDTKDLYLHAYGRKHDDGSDETYLVENYLKFAISDLRQKLMGKVRGFLIPDKQRSAGYRCTGAFTFCIVMAREQERTFKVRTYSGSAES